MIERITKLVVHSFAGEQTRRARDRVQPNTATIKRGEAHY